MQKNHAKRWFAGQAGNWKLADFEIGEIQETIDDIKKYCISDRNMQQLSSGDQTRVQRNTGAGYPAIHQPSV